MVLERSNIFEIQINIQCRLNCSQTHSDLAYVPQSRYDVYSKAASMIGRSFEKTVFENDLMAILLIDSLVDPVDFKFEN